MIGMNSRAVAMVVLAALLVLSGVTVPAAAGPENETNKTAEYYAGEMQDARDTGEDRAYAGMNKASSERVQKAFTQAKKAFHEARQEIQAIKKGDESPVEDVPSFFEDDGDDDGDEKDD